MSSIIEVKGLHKKYGSVHAVRGIDFAVESGTLFAFLGPNGAGKSTTIDIICTLLKCDEGEVIVDGLQLSRDDAKIRERIGVVFQDSLLDPLLTVRENLTFRARFYQKNRSDVNSAVKRAIEITNSTEYSDRQYGKLSGGQRRRADIARALLNTPKILFLDEPTTGLDPQTKQNVWETVSKLRNDNGMTVFLTTHYMEEAAQADCITVIDKGKIAATGTPLELKERYTSDFLKIKPIDETLSNILSDKGYSYKKQGDFITINLKCTKDSIKILSEFEHKIDSFEVLHGTMDDVFINITGREIREDA